LTEDAFTKSDTAYEKLKELNKKVDSFNLNNDKKFASIEDKIKIQLKKTFNYMEEVQNTLK
jgi:hypothetical protein